MDSENLKRQFSNNLSKYLLDTLDKNHYGIKIA